MTKKPIYMYLQEVKKTSGEFDATHKVALYPDNVDEAPKWFSNFINNDFKKILDRLDNIESRLDKIEQFDHYVIDQFKKHGWVK